MNISDIFAAIQQAVQAFVVDAGIVAPEFTWLKELIAEIVEWFSGLFA